MMQNGSVTDKVSPEVTLDSVLSERVVGNKPIADGSQIKVTNRVTKGGCGSKRRYIVDFFRNNPPIRKGDVLRFAREHNLSYDYVRKVLSQARRAVRRGCRRSQIGGGLPYPPSRDGQPLVVRVHGVESVPLPVDDGVLARFWSRLPVVSRGQRGWVTDEWTLLFYRARGDRGCARFVFSPKSPYCYESLRRIVSAYASEDFFEALWESIVKNARYLRIGASVSRREKELPDFKLIVKGDLRVQTGRSYIDAHGPEADVSTWLKRFVINYRETGSVDLAGMVSAIETAYEGRALRELKQIRGSLKTFAEAMDEHMTLIESLQGLVTALREESRARSRERGEPRRPPEAEPSTPHRPVYEERLPPRWREPKNLWVESDHGRRSRYHDCHEGREKPDSSCLSRYCRFQCRLLWMVDKMKGEEARLMLLQGG